MQNFVVKAIVRTVGTELKSKVYDNGATGQYITCTVEFNDPSSPFHGKKWFANRTLVNKLGSIKPSVEVGEEVTAHIRKDMYNGEVSLLADIAKLGIEVDSIEDILSGLSAVSDEAVKAQALA